MGADDLLPVFTYCVVRSRLRHPLTTAVLLRDLMADSDALQRGEAGYYFILFISAVQHILEMPCG